jgi:hypothetical protein
MRTPDEILLFILPKLQAFGWGILSRGTENQAARTVFLELAEGG